MSGFNNAGMGMGLGDVGLGGGSGRLWMDDFQQPTANMGMPGVGVGGGLTNGNMVGGMALGGNAGGSDIGMAGIGQPSLGQLGLAHPSLGQSGLGGFPGSNPIGGNQVLPHAGRSDDDLLLSLLRERERSQMQMSGGLSGVVPLSYNGGPSASALPSSRPGLQGGFALTSGNNLPLDQTTARVQEQNSGLAFSPYMMMRDMQNNENMASAGMMQHEQQRSAMPAMTNNPSTSGNFFSLQNSFDPTPTSQTMQMQRHAAGEMQDQMVGAKEHPVMAAPVASLQQKAPPKAEPKAPSQKSSTTKVGKKIKDAPRRPLSAYNLFFSDERERILKEREGTEGGGKIQVQEMAKIIGARWRQLSDNRREYYQQLADEDMKRHREAKKNQPKDVSVPKRPPTAFLLFSNKRRKALKSQNPSATNSDLSKMLSKAWREADDSIRRGYIEEASALSKAYKAEMVSWRKTSGDRKNGTGDGDDEGMVAKAGQRGDDIEGSSGKRKMGFTLPAKKRKTKDPSAPKRPLSAFLAYSNTRRKALKQQYPDATNADLSKMLAKMWKEAPTDFRQEFIDEAAKKSEAYKVEMAEWRMKSGN